MRYLKLLAIALLIVACSRLSESHLNDLKADEMTAPLITFDDAVKDGYFKYSALADSMCGIDQQGTDTWCEIATNGNLYFTSKNNQ